MVFPVTDFSKLAAHFPREGISWRPQGNPFKRGDEYSCMALAYIDARDVMQRLDDVCGIDGWSDSYVETVKGRVICTIKIDCGDGWVSKSDGAGDTQVEGEKGGISDAFKRAAVKWGIGRYLYDIDAPWVPCEVNQRSDKVYWKAWKADPWTKVRNAPKEPRPADPPANPRNSDLKPGPNEARTLTKAEGEAIVEGINARDTAADVQIYMKALRAGPMAFAADHPKIKAAVDARIRELDPFGLPASGEAA